MKLLIIKFLTVLFILCIIWNVGSVVWQHSTIYFSHTYWQNFPTLKQTYLDSQYVNKHPKGWIPDEIVNAYAGGAYIRGVEPQLIAPDTPPLGRYLIGISTILFDNPSSITLFSATLALIGIFLVAKQILKNTLFALIPVVAFSSEPIFKNQLIYTPLLDIMQLVFLIFSFYFFNRSFSSKKSWVYYLATSFCIGCFIATKFFATGITLIGACLLILLFRRQIKNSIVFLLTTPLTIGILLLSYVKALFSGYSLKAFVGIQKWVFLYHKSQLILPFSIWPLLLLNKWYVWYGNKPVISDAQWIITWPIITILTGIVIALYLLKKIQRNNAVEVLMMWVVLYILFFSFGQIASRYFVIYIPILYIISVFGLVEIGKKLYENRT